MIQSFKLAINSILTNKMRSFLTMLGIIIGVAAVIILVSVVSGYMGQVIESFASMGVNRISINVRNTRTRSLDDKVMYEFLDENYEIVNKLSPEVSVSGTVKNGNNSLTSTTIMGVSEDYMDIVSYKLEQGRNLSYSDLAGRSAVCVIGYYVAYDLFGSSDKAINDSLKVNGKPLTIVGVIEPQEEIKNMSEGGTDDFVWMPYTLATKMTRNGNISNYYINSVDTSYTDEITDKLKSTLYGIFKSENFYSVFANSSIISELDSSIGTLSALLGGIAGISLLVAGIGVMNIMLVSVTERTREIGIRKALGAKQGVIMQQFVIEAAVTSTLGGLIGIILGSVLTSVVGAAMSITCYPTIGSIILSVSVSVGIGLLFGYLPAKRAAVLNPIDALRTD
ncbi:MAG: ABC transporter permease [Eubacteriales bacterium]|nr:ABC transporter permease [Eubacteriales bacterium]